jgi:hypothetical protein
VSLVSGEDRSYFRDIERLIGKKIEQQIIPGYEVGSGYHSAQPEPQGRRGQQRQNQPRNSGGQRNGQRNQGSDQRSQGNGQRNQGNGQRAQGNGQQRSQGHGQRRSQPSSGRGSERNERGGGFRPTPSGRGRDGSEQVRSGRPPQRQVLPVLPHEKIQQSVRQEQLEYHRHQQQADEQRSEAAPANERAKDKAVPALFGVVGRKVA